MKNTLQHLAEKSRLNHCKSVLSGTYPANAKNPATTVLKSDDGLKFIYVYAQYK